MHPSLDPLTLLSPTELDQELWHTDPTSALVAGSQPSGTCQDRDPDLAADPGEDHDSLAGRLRAHDTSWTLDLADPTAWHPQPPDHGQPPDHEPSDG